jgi:glucan phosphorylase
MIPTHPIELTFSEAEFLAHWIDATLMELEEIQKKPDDYLAAQIFLGKSVPADYGAEEFISGVDDQANGLLVIRTRLKIAFGI